MGSLWLFVCSGFGGDGFSALQQAHQPGKWPFSAKPLKALEYLNSKWGLGGALTPAADGSLGSPWFLFNLIDLHVRQSSLPQME